MDNFKIDGNALEVECIRQLDLMEHWAFESSNAKKATDELKHKLERTELRVDTQVRTNPRDHGLIKPTEAGIKKAVEGHPEVLKLKGRLVEAKARASEADAAMTCLDHRKRMLEVLTRLHGQGYFSEIVREENTNGYNVPDVKNSRPLR